MTEPTPLTEAPWWPEYERWRAAIAGEVFGAVLIYMRLEQCRATAKEGGVMRALALTMHHRLPPPEWLSEALLRGYARALDGVTLDEALGPVRPPYTHKHATPEAREAFAERAYGLLFDHPEWRLTDEEYLAALAGLEATPDKPDGPSVETMRRRIADMPEPWKTWARKMSQKRGRRTQK